MDAILAQTQQKALPDATDLVAEANHRIANSLTLLVSMVRMQALSVKKRQEVFSNTEVRQLLDGVAARITTISQLHRILSHVGPRGAISLKPHLREVTDALVAALSLPEQAVRVVHTGNDCMVLTRQVQPIVLILCEIFINAVKYAHPAGVPLIMVADCAPGADGRLVLNCQRRRCRIAGRLRFPSWRRHGVPGDAQPGGGNRWRIADSLHPSRLDLPPGAARLRHGRRQAGLTGRP